MNDYIYFCEIIKKKEILKILGVIPVRYASTRFPAKSLIDIKGKSMIRRVYEQAIKSKSLTEVVIATDHELIFNHVKDFGGKAVLTSENHPSGTDRCFEALKKNENNFDFVINIQGDEPFIDPNQIDVLSDCLTAETELATLIQKITNPSQITDIGEAKVVLNSNNEAIYFSRSPIPFVRNAETEKWLDLFPFYRHVGMYAYRSDILKKITNLSPSILEKAESLEQLRWIENGFKIKVAFTDFESPCIDTPEDLQKALIWMDEMKIN